MLGHAVSSEYGLRLRMNQHLKLNTLLKAAIAGATYQSQMFEVFPI